MLRPGWSNCRYPFASPPAPVSRLPSPVLLSPIHLHPSSFSLPPVHLLLSSFLPSSFLPSAFSFLLPPVQVRGFSSVYAGTWMRMVPQRALSGLRPVQVRGFSAFYAVTWMRRVPPRAFCGLRPVQVGGFSADYAGTWIGGRHRGRSVACGQSRSEGFRPIMLRPG